MPLYTFTKRPLKILPFSQHSKLRYAAIHKMMSAFVKVIIFIFSKAAAGSATKQIFSISFVPWLKCISDKDSEACFNLSQRQYCFCSSQHSATMSHENLNFWLAVTSQTSFLIHSNNLVLFFHLYQSCDITSMSIITN